jgi:hypothetical protein
MLDANQRLVVHPASNPSPTVAADTTTAIGHPCMSETPNAGATTDLLYQISRQATAKSRKIPTNLALVDLDNL